MLNNHPHDLLPFYINGTLSEAEQTAVEAHLQTCPSCQAELEEWHEIARAVQSNAENAAVSLPPLKLPPPLASGRIVPISSLTPNQKSHKSEDSSMSNQLHLTFLNIRSLRGSLALIAALTLVAFGVVILGRGIEGLFPSDNPQPTAYHTGQTTLVGPTGTPQPTLPTVYDILQSDPSLSQFAATIAGNGGLTADIQLQDQTIFVLPNDVYAPIETELRQGMGEYEDGWMWYIRNYMVGGSWSLEKLTEKPFELTRFSSWGGRTYTADTRSSYDANGTYILNGMAHITKSIEASNGYVHILDAPLVTAESFLAFVQSIESIDVAPTACDVLSYDAQYFKMLLYSLEGSDGDWIRYTVCQNMGTFTLFAPSDDAIKDSFPSSGTWEDFRRFVLFTPEANEVIQKFVMAHLLSGLWSQDRLAELGVVRSSWEPDGQAYANSVNAHWNNADPHQLVINDRAKVTKGDVITPNGIIHYVDAPLVSFFDIAGNSPLSELVPQPLESAPEGTPATLANDLNTLMAIADPAERQARLDTLWAEWQAAGQIPYVEGETAAFLYRGSAMSVEWRGDFSGWFTGRGLVGQNLKDTDLWIALAEFPTDARLNYQIVLNNGIWMLDPANPHQEQGTNGPNSELRMPDFVPSEWSERRESIPHGTVSDVLQTMGPEFILTQRVYTPANYDALDNLPVIYVLDDYSYSDERRGTMRNILDNLIAEGKIEPVIVVFINHATSPDTPRTSRTNAYTNNPDFAENLATVVADIDRDYKTDARPERRLIMGLDLAGQAALFTALQNPNDLPIFGLAGAQSPTFDEALLDLYSQAPTHPLDIWLSSGTPEWDVDITPLQTVIEQSGYPLTTVQVNDGHSWGNWRGLLDDLLIHFFGTEKAE